MADGIGTGGAVGIIVLGGQDGGVHDALLVADGSVDNKVTDVLTHHLLTETSLVSMTLSVRTVLGGTTDPGGTDSGDRHCPFDVRITDSGDKLDLTRRL